MIIKNKILSLLLIIATCGLVHCGGDDSSSSPTSPTDFTPSFSPSSSESLDSMIVNTFDDNGYDISISPETIDFNEEDESIEKDDELTREFVLTNNSGTVRTFKFALYAVSSGFSILDENKINLGSWDAITLEDGESRTFYARFNAWLFGTQTTYITVTADAEGYIQLPLRASVSGASDFRIIPMGYLCSDTEAPEVSSIDFLKVAYGQTETQGIKLCNTGGEDIEVSTVEVTTATSSQRSRVFDTNAYEEFIWDVEDEINSAFALGLEPTFTDTFSEPELLDAPYADTDSATDYAVKIHETQELVNDVIVSAGKILTLDVNLTPSLDFEAPTGALYAPVDRNARLRIKTSLGKIDIPLVGATSGKEPVLKMSYRLADTEVWREVDLSSDGATIYFGSVSTFKDWVTDNFKAAELLIENVGSGSKNLEFYPASLAGYFEYYDETGAVPQFPFEIPSGSAGQNFQIRYMPTPTEVSTRATWDFGQFYFEHTGGNGPYGKLALVGEEESGYAVELKFGGSKLEREYDDTESKYFCAMQIDNGSASATRYSLTVTNNNKEHDLTVDWNVTEDSDSEGDFTATEDSGSLTVAKNSSQSFEIQLLADSDTSEGATIRGILNVETHYPSDVEAAYAVQLSGLEERDFQVPFHAQATSTGECTLGGGSVIGKDSSGTVQATIIVDRIGMVLTSLTEAAQNPPSFKFHLPVEIDYENNRVRISDDIPFVYDKNSPDFTPIKQFRSYAHQITNINNCAPKPTNPYRLEFEKGSWTGDGYDCNEKGDVAFTGKDGSSYTIDTDTACLPSNGGEEVEVDGVKWVVFYQDFVKFDTGSCQMQYYGKVATFAYRPDIETFADVFARSEASPNEGEDFYEGIYGAFQFNSYIFFNEKTSCGSKSYNAGESETDPDLVKACYASIAEKEDNTRNEGLINECAYFNFIIDEGVVPSDATSSNPNTDNWSGYGIYEPHSDETGTYDTKYDITLYNVHAQAFALSPADRFSFFQHPGHLLYSELYVTFTTKQIADQNDTSHWDDLVAVETRPNFDKENVYLDSKTTDVVKFWTNSSGSYNDFNNLFSNVLEDEDLESGVDYGGYGKGNYRLCESGGAVDCDIIPAGWPVNFDENNLITLVGVGSFNGKGNTAPGFAREDSSGQGKSLYFTLHGCLVEGEPSETQGCYNYHLDDARMTYDDNTANDATLVIDEYVDHGMLPEGYPTNASDCVSFAALPENDPLNALYDPYKYMSCINYKIFPQDRDRLTNYYDSDKFYYEDDDYKSSTCGYGM